MITDVPNQIPFPEFPSSKSALLIPIIYLIFVISFTTIEYFSNYQTNPVIFFSILNILSIIVVLSMGVKFESLIDALGADTNRPWQLWLSISIGFILGSILFSMLNPLSIYGVQPTTTSVIFANTLNIGMPLSTSGTKSGINILFFSWVGFAEEIMCLVMMAVITNYIVTNSRINTKNAIIIGAVISRIIWAIQHFVEYTVINALGIPSYILAVILGLIFTGLSMMFYFKTGNTKLDTIWYFPEPVLAGAVIAHITYDVLIGLKYISISALPFTYSIGIILLIPTLILFLQKEKNMI